MSIALSEFWTRLVRGGLADAAECKRMAGAFAKARGAPASDSGGLAEFLVETGELTDFQARGLLADSPAMFRFGGFVRQTDDVTVPLSHWLSVRAIADRREGFLIRVGPNQLSPNRQQWLRAHAAVVAAALQPIELHHDTSSGIVDVFSELPSGRCLANLTAEKMKVNRRQALSIGIAVAEALNALHSGSLVHGSVRADRVWLSESGQTMLLRDPSGPPPTPRQDHSAAWIDVLESPASYAAPEFADPNFVGNPLTDIYSLGCLLFRMVVGRMPFAGPTVEAEIAAHVNEAPLELSQALQQGEAGDPVLRVTAYVMAKNPAARFATATQVADALKAVLAMETDQQAGTSALRAAAPSQAETKPQTPPPAAAAPPPPKVESRITANESEITEPPPVATSAKRPSSQKRSAPKSSGSATPPPVSKPPQEQLRERQPAREADIQSKPTPPPTQPPKATEAENTTTRENTATREKPAVSDSGRGEAPAAPSPAGKPTSAGKPSGFPRQKAKPPAPVERGGPPPAAPVPVINTAAFDDAGDALKPPPLPSEAAATSGEDRPARRRRKKKSNVPFVFGVLSVPVLLMVIFLIVQGSGGEKNKEKKQGPRLPDQVPTVGQARKEQPKPPEPAPAAAAPAGYQLVDSDRLLWVPPYGADTDTASLELLPPGPGIIVSVKLADMMQDPIGRELIDALSPELSALIKSAADRARVPAESIQRCTIAMHAGKEGWPATSLVIELTEAMSLESLADRWQASASRTADGATVYSGDGPDVYYLGDSENGALANDASVKRFALGPVAQIQEVAANEGGAIPLPRLMNQVWKKSSVESDLIALITPNFLFADGREMLRSAAPEMVDPLRSFLIPDVAAVLISAKTGDQNLYAEMCLMPSGGVTEAKLMRNTNDAMTGLPTWAENFLVDSVPDQSWRLLATRMPLMFQFLVDHTRFGASDGTIVANAYLPAPAATQITMTTLLAMNTQPGSSSSVAVADTAEEPLTVEQMLNRKMSVDFDQESLEFGINVIVDQFKSDLPDGSTMPNVRIIGGDLETAGITQNQQIRDFSKADLPLRTVLTDLLLGANPDKTATGPKDPKQALVWVVVPKAGAPGGAEILITTRAASAGVYELPDEFKPEE